MTETQYLKRRNIIKHWCGCLSDCTYLAVPNQWQIIYHRMS